MRAFLLLFVIAPACELGLLIWSGITFGTLNTVLMIIATGVGGAYLAKHQGLKTLERVKHSLSQGYMPNEEYLDGLCILLGGLLLLAPGFITDLLGLALLLPPTRKFLKKPLKRMLYKKVSRNTITIIQQ